MKGARETAMPSMTTGTSVQGKESSPFLIAAKMGVVEIVRTFLNYSPIVIHQEDADKKNALMLAVENKHPNTYKLLLENCRPSRESVFQKVDNNGNNAFHLAATVVEDHPWRIRGTALQIQWELKWYKHIQSSVPHQLFALRNNNGKTSREVFDDAHKEMVKDGAKWLTKTAQSCSVVAALIASVVYASATTVPGGVKEGTGIPLLRSQPAFNIFTVSSLVALCLSVTSLTVFLSILTSRYHVSNFLHYLPIKLLLGLTSLFVSIAAMLVSFCAGHFFDLSDQLRQRAYLIYAITCFPVTVYAATQFPLYFDLIKSIKTKVPQRNHMSSTI